MGLTINKQRIVTEALVSIALGVGIKCLIVEVMDDKAFLQDVNEITFSDEDMEVAYLDHRRPLYLAVSINRIPIKRALVDTDASKNLISLGTLQIARILERKIQGCPMEVIGFGGRGEYTAGHIQLWLRVGLMASLFCFYVVKMEVSYHILLGRSWLHKHQLVPSTYHQCINGRLNGRMIWIAANPSPFKQAEAYLVENMFYDEWAPSRESSMSKPQGTFILRWEDIQDDPEPNLRRLLMQRKKMKDRKKKAIRKRTKELW